MFDPHIHVLPAAQKKLWNELAEIPKNFVLYGGTALALRLGHRQSIDFDFFTSRTIIPEELLSGLKLLRTAQIIQNTSQTLTVTVNHEGPVKLSFFGSISIGRVGTPDETSDGVLGVASLLDLAGTKAKVVLQRAEAKDYLDLLAIFQSGTSLSQAMAAALSLYGDQYNPMLTIKSLSYFGDGDLHRLTSSQKNQLIKIASDQELEISVVQKIADELSKTKIADLSNL
jgi:predicted nucleotidyltransferase component of viral defense system